VYLASANSACCLTAEESVAAGAILSDSVFELLQASKMRPADAKNKIFLIKIHFR